MIHYYVQKGRLPSEIYNLPENEKVFLYASMLVELKGKRAGMCPLFGK